jgi:hypothetical protein
MSKEKIQRNFESLLVGTPVYFLLEVMLCQ